MTHHGSNFHSEPLEIAGLEASYTSGPGGGLYCVIWRKYLIPSRGMRASLCLGPERRGHIPCPGDMWEHLQPLALLKTLLLSSSFRSPVAARPKFGSKLCVWGSLLRMVTSACSGLGMSLLLPRLLLPLPERFLGLLRCPGFGRNPQTIGVKETNGDLVEPRSSRPPACLHHCPAPLTSCSAFPEISMPIWNQGWVPPPPLFLVKAAPWRSRGGAVACVPVPSNRA